MNDFSKFVCFVKGTLITAEVIKHSPHELRNEMKMHFNRIVKDCADFEKDVHRHLGADLAEMEDDINSAVVGLVWSLFDLPTQERGQFIDYINQFEFKPKNEENVQN